MGMPVFSPDGKNLAFRARKKDKWFVVLNGKKGKAYQEVKRPIFSPDSSRLAYTAALEEEMVLVLDEIEGQAFEAVGIPWFSPDGGHLACTVLTEGKWAISVDNTLTRHRFDGFIKNLPLVFESAKKLHGFAMNAEPRAEFFRIEVEIL